MKFRVGDKVGKKYSIVKKLGEGSFGTIYLAEHIATKQLIAVKTESINT